MQNKIIDYINKIKKEDIIFYCNKNNISITQNEIDILYDYIKYRYNDFFNNPLQLLNEIKTKVSNDLYVKVKLLYDKYKFFIN